MFPGGAGFRTQEHDAEEGRKRVGLKDEAPELDRTELTELVQTAASYFITDDEAAAMLKTAQSTLEDADTGIPARAAARKVLNALARNTSTPAAVLHGLIVFHDGTAERERDWSHGCGHEETTRIVVHNPSTAVRTLEVIAGTEGGRVRYEAWKQLRVRAVALEEDQSGSESE